MQENALQQLRDVGLRSYQGDRWAAAITALESYTQFAADDTYAWFVLGDALRMIGNFAAAEDALHRALESADNPTAVARTTGYLGILQFDQGRCSDAIGFFRKSFEIGEGILSNNILGGLYIFCARNSIRLSQYDDALVWLGKARDAGDDEALYWTGLVHRAMRDYDEAARCFMEPILDSSMIVNRRDQANDCRRAAMIVRSNSAVGADILEEFVHLADDGLIASASEQFQFLSESEARDALHQQTYLQILVDLYRFDEALLFLDKMRVPVDNSDRHSYHGTRGNLYRAIGQFQFAVTEYTAALSCAPREYVWYRVFKGASLMHLGEFEEARAQFEAGLNIGDVDGELHLNLGYALRALGAYDEASQEFESALAIDKDYTEAIDALGSLNGLKETRELLPVRSKKSTER